MLIGKSAVTVEERLAELEKQIRERAGEYISAREVIQKIKADLSEAVQEYQAVREKAQRDLWKKNGLGWCQACHKFFPRRNIRLLYSVGREFHGGNGYETYSFYRRLESFCLNCAERMLSKPRGGASEFQCYKARRTRKGFEIFVSGCWQSLPDKKGVLFDIERSYTPESEYAFGKIVKFDNYPTPDLKIGDEVIARGVY